MNSVRVRGNPVRYVQVVTSFRCLVVAAVLSWALVTAAAASGQMQSPPVAGAPTQEPGAPRAEPPPAFARLCVRCHASTKIVEGRRSRSQWGEVLDQMVARGATGSDEDFNIVMEFLVSEYGRVSVNSAPAEELAQVLHLDPKEADAIVEYRKSRGPFADFDALIAMPGAPVEALRKRRDAIVF